MHHFCTFACLALVIHSWHSLTHSYIHSLAHSFIHSFIRLTYVDSDVCCPRLLLFLFEFLLNNCTKKGADGRERKGQAGGGCMGGVGVAYRDALIAYLVKCCHGSPTRQTRHKVRYIALPPPPPSPSHCQPCPSSSSPSFPLCCPWPRFPFSFARSAAMDD